MKSSGLIIIPKVGMLPSEAFMKKAMEQFPTFWGSAVRIQETGNEPEFVISGTDEIPSVADFLEILKQDIDNQQIIYGCKADSHIEAESEQPFIILRHKETDQPVLVGFIEGSYLYEDDNQTNEFHAADKLTAYLRKMFALCDFNIVKFEADFLADDATDAYITSLCTTRGIVSLFSVSGVTYTYEKANEGVRGEYPWGFTSNSLGYVEKSVTEEIAKKDEPKKSMLSRFGRGKTKEAPVIANTESVGTTIAKENAKEATVAKAPIQLIAPPDDLVKKGLVKVKGWYETWTEGVDKDSHPLTEKQMRAGAPAVANARWIAKKAGTTLPLKEGLANLKANGTVGLPSDTKKYNTIMSTKMKDVLRSFFESGEIKMLVENSKVLNTETLKNGPKVASFSEQQDYPIEKMFRWDDETITKFIEKCVEKNDIVPIAALIKELRDNNVDLLIAHPSDTKAEEEMDDGAVVVNTEVVNAEPAPKPTETIKKGGLLNRFKQTKAA